MAWHGMGMVGTIPMGIDWARLSHHRSNCCFTQHRFFTQQCFASVGCRQQLRRLFYYFIIIIIVIIIIIIVVIIIVIVIIIIIVMMLLLLCCYYHYFDCRQLIGLSLAHISSHMFIHMSMHIVYTWTRYLRVNVTEFGLLERIRFGCTVNFVTPVGEHGAAASWGAHKWRVEWVHHASDGSKSTHSELFDGVLVCTGSH